jgi:hypothetical protein
VVNVFASLKKRIQMKIKEHVKVISPLSHDCQATMPSHSIHMGERRLRLLPNVSLAQYVFNRTLIKHTAQSSKA